MGGFVGGEMPAESAAIVPVPPKAGAYRGGWMTRRSIIIFGLKQFSLPFRSTRKRRVRVLDAKLNGKIGFLLGRGQRLRDLTLRGARGGGWQVAPSRKVTDELVSAFGKPRHQQWAGFGVVGPAIDPSYPLRISCGYRIRVGRITAKSWFQTVPVVFGFKVEGFDQHYLLGLSVLKRSGSPVTTFTGQPSMRGSRRRRG